MSTYRRAVYPLTPDEKSPKSTLRNNIWQKYDHYHAKSPSNTRTSSNFSSSGSQNSSIFNLSPPKSRNEFQSSPTLSTRMPPNFQPLSPDEIVSVSPRSRSPSYRTSPVRSRSPSYRDRIYPLTMRSNYRRPASPIPIRSTYKPYATY